MRLEARIGRLEGRLAIEDHLRPRFVWVYVGRYGLDYSAMGFRRPDAAIEAVHHGKGISSVMLRVPEEADYEDCHTFMAGDQLDIALFVAENVNLLLWPPRRSVHLKRDDPPITSVFEPSQIETTRRIRRDE